MGRKVQAWERAGRPRMRSPGRPPVWRREHRQRFWAAIARGLTSEEAGVEAGVSPAVGVRWFREGGGMPSVTQAPVSDRYLSFAEREEIAILRAQGSGVREIARQLGRSPSTISRALRRNAATRGGVGEGRRGALRASFNRGRPGRERKRRRSGDLDVRAGDVAQRSTRRLRVAALALRARYAGEREGENSEIVRTYETHQTESPWNPVRLRAWRRTRSSRGSNAPPGRAGKPSTGRRGPVSTQHDWMEGGRR